MQNEDQLMDVLTTPSSALVEEMSSLDGDLVVLGVGGKVGPTLAIRAARALNQSGSSSKVYGVARFSDPRSAEVLKKGGVIPFKADVTDENQLSNLPDAKNLVYMVGHKFGSTNNEHYTWMMNSYLPGRVAQRYPDARTVAFSTLLIYSMAPHAYGGSRESDLPNPFGEYAASCVGRERVYEHFARKNSTPLTKFRLGYAIEMRYGVLSEIAWAVKSRTPIPLAMGHASVIWQGDAAEYALRSLRLADTPPVEINASGPETVSIRSLAHQFAEKFDTEPVFEGEEEDNSYLLNGTKAHEAFGYPSVTLPKMVDWVANWVNADGGKLGKPTKFQERGGQF